MKILIISGFLGSGKTSFIKAMAKATGREFVIVENEFGELGIDGEILKQDLPRSETDAEMKIWELSEGCICCSLNLDFSLSVLTIHNAINPDYLVVEPSGVAMLSKILQQIHRVRYGDIELLAPVTVVDYENYLISKREFSEYFDDQVASAGILVVSKSEGVDPEDFDKLKEQLSLADDVLFPREHYSKWRKEDWDRILTRKLLITEDKDKPFSFQDMEVPKEQALESLSLVYPGINNPDELYHALEKLIAGDYGRIVRAKGYMGKKHGFRFELVEGTFLITGMEKVEHPRIVVIGKHLKRSEIRKLFSIDLSKPMKLKISKERNL